jgi:histone acetyltransferase
MRKDRWAPGIKDYEGGTLMECYINPNINYLEIPLMVKRQRKVMDDKIAELTRQHAVHPGVTTFKQSPGTLLELHQIPGVVEAGYSKEAHTAGNHGLTEHESSKEMLSQTLAQVLGNLHKNDNAWPFKEPVSATDVPDYHTVVKDPMDLSTIQARLDQVRPSTAAGPHRLVAPPRADADAHCAARFRDSTRPRRCSSRT